jgi:TPR repeat protein
LKKHLMEAASRGNAEAQFNLAMICENGAADSRYTNQGNHSEAMRWLLAAATQGLPRAQIKLAEFYALEAETPEGSVKACGWYLIAIANLEGIRLKDAQAAYRRLSDPLTPMQRDEAGRFAEDWEPMDAALIAGLDLSGAAARA